MKLYLARHGTSVTEAQDSKKPLSKNGVVEVNKIAKFLTNSNIIQLSNVYHSDKLRAIQTAQILADNLDKSVKLELKQGLQPNSPVEVICEQANAWNSDTLLVGHLPFMSNCASMLLFGTEDAHKFTFNTGSVMCLDKLGPGVWSLDWFVSPILC